MPGALLSLAVFCFVCASALADKVVLTIRASNPAPFAQDVEIRADLPARVTPREVMDAGGLDVVYDVKKQAYYVYKKIEFGPKELRRFVVELDDIWVIPDKVTVQFREHLQSLSVKLKGTDYEQEAAGLVDGILQELDAIATRQESSAIGVGTGPIQHIGAYETNLKALGGVRRRVARIEDMVMMTGQDPGSLIDPHEDDPVPAKHVQLPDSGYKTAVITVSVRNTSPTSARSVTVNRELPAELLAADVLDPGGLEVGTHAESGMTYVYKDNVEVPPGETVTFTVVVRDKWNVNAPRVVGLRKDIDELQKAVAEQKDYKSVEEVLAALLEDLGGIEGESGPERLDRDYVAFYRDQTRRVDSIERTVTRIRAVMRGTRVSSTLGFNVKPPSMKTTWMIIYIVLGFLGVVSLLFFFRWYGKSKAERMESPEPEES